MHVVVKKEINIGSLCFSLNSHYFYGYSCCVACVCFAIATFPLLFLFPLFSYSLLYLLSLWVICASFWAIYVDIKRETTRFSNCFRLVEHLRGENHISYCHCFCCCETISRHQISFLLVFQQHRLMQQQWNIDDESYQLSYIRTHRYNWMRKYVCECDVCGISELVKLMGNQLNGQGEQYNKSMLKAKNWY